jgi:hypothetical protein
VIEKIFSLKPTILKSQVKTKPVTQLITNNKKKSEINRNLLLKTQESLSSSKNMNMKVINPKIKKKSLEMKEKVLQISNNVVQRLRL